MGNKTGSLLIGIFVFLISFTGFQFSVLAQEMYGVGLGNYSGVMSTLYNPAMLTNTKTFLDVNIATADVFFRNNMYYIPKSDYSIFKAIRLQAPPKYGSDSINALLYNNYNTKFVNLSLRTIGPSASFQYGNHGFALTTGARFFISGNNIPWEFPVISYIGIKDDSIHNINFIDYNLDLSSTAWMEVGLSYAYNVYKYYDKQLTVGVTIRKIWGYAGLSLAANNFNYIIVNDSTINIKNMNSTLGFALPVNYNKNEINNNPFFKGNGYSLDVGVVYVKKKRGYRRWDKYSLCSQPYEDYDYRIGVSILDLGNIKFKNNAQYHAYNDVNIYWENYDTLNYSSVNQVINSLSNVFYGNPTTSLQANSFSIGLPTAVSVQMDFHILKNFYTAGFWIHPISFNSHSIRRAAQIAVVPRYETRRFEISLPFSMYDYKYYRVGLAARFGFFTIGTERLGTWLGMADLNGLDIYASIKFNFGIKGYCHSRRESACQNGEYGYTAKQRKMFLKHHRR